VQRLGLGPARGGVPLGGVAFGVGRRTGIGDQPGALGLGVATGLVGVLVGVSPYGTRRGLRVLAQCLDLADDTVADLGGLGLGQGEDMADALTEVLVRRQLRLLRLPGDQRLP
jgi:hypothetical protein